ncbi:tyrosine-protein kinase [Sarcoptes scabiei]|nr:tyrosine-protein kinase [Sarcoptes scabiei]
MDVCNLDHASIQKLISWIRKEIESKSEADPDILAKYVVALIQKSLPEHLLRQKCLSQLDLFLHEQTAPFIDKLFDVVKAKTYLSSPNEASCTSMTLMSTSDDAKNVSSMSSEVDSKKNHVRNNDLSSADNFPNVGPSTSRTTNVVESNRKVASSTQEINESKSKVEKSRKDDDRSDSTASDHSSKDSFRFKCRRSRKYKSRYERKSNIDKYDRKDQYDSDQNSFDEESLSSESDERNCRSHRYRRHKHRRSSTNNCLQTSNSISVHSSNDRSSRNGNSRRSSSFHRYDSQNRRHNQNLKHSNYNSNYRQAINLSDYPSSNTIIGEIRNKNVHEEDTTENPIVPSDRNMTSSYHHRNNHSRRGYPNEEYRPNRFETNTSSTNDHTNRADKRLGVHHRSNDEFSDHRNDSQKSNRNDLTVQEVATSTLNIVDSSSPQHSNNLSGELNSQDSQQNMNKFEINSSTTSAPSSIIIANPSLSSYGDSMFFEPYNPESAEPIGQSSFFQYLLPNFAQNNPNELNSNPLFQRLFRKRAKNYQWPNNSNQSNIVRPRELVGVSMIDQKANDSADVIQKIESSTENENVFEPNSEIRKNDETIEVDSNHQNEAIMSTDRHQFSNEDQSNRPMFDENKALIIRKIPPNLNNIGLLHKHFSQFGHIVNIEVYYQNKVDAALIQFKSRYEASLAIRSTEAVLNNRFIKVYWFKSAFNNKFNDNNMNSQSNNRSQKKSSVSEHLNNVASKRLKRSFTDLDNDLDENNLTTHDIENSLGEEEKEMNREINSSHMSKTNRINRLKNINQQNQSSNHISMKKNEHGMKSDSNHLNQISLSERIRLQKILKENNTKLNELIINQKNLLEKMSKVAKVAEKSRIKNLTDANFEKITEIKSLILDTQEKLKPLLRTVKIYNHK